MNPQESMLTADRCVRLHARNVPDRIAVSEGARRLSYLELDERIDRLVSAFEALGLRAGDRLAAFLRNRIEWAEILLACARSGIICVPVNSRFVDTEILYVLRHSKSRALIVDAALLSRISRRDIAGLDLVSTLVVGGSQPGSPDGCDDYERWLAQSSVAAMPTREVRETDCWYFGYTSGTTGRPKAVIVNHRSRVLSACLAATEFGVGETDKTLLTMPLFHSNGIFFLLLLLHVGGTAYIVQEFDAEEILRAIDEYGITLISMVPTMYSMILALPDETKARYQIDSLRVTISSSAPLLAKTKEDMLAFFPGASIYEFYGSSEASFVTCLKPRDQARKLRSVGKPFLATEVRLLNEAGDPVGPGEVGELWSRSPMQTFDGYVDDPDANAAAYKPGGWFCAGDLATADDEGFLYIVDRKKDLIISGGENVYPTEVEDVLVRHPSIREAAVVGLPHDVWGDQVCAVVCLNPGKELTLAELRRWAKTQMADFKCPRQLLIWSDLPKGPTGKLLRRAIREQLSSN